MFFTAHQAVKIELQSRLTDVHSRDSRSRALRGGCCFWDSPPDLDTASCSTSDVVHHPASPAVEVLKFSVELMACSAIHCQATRGFKLRLCIASDGLTMATGLEWVYLETVLNNAENISANFPQKSKPSVPVGRCIEWLRCRTIREA